MFFITTGHRCSPYACSTAFVLIHLKLKAHLYLNTDLQHKMQSSYYILFAICEISVILL